MTPSATGSCACGRLPPVAPAWLHKGSMPDVPCARGQVAARRRLFRAALRAVRSWLGSRRTWVRRRPPWMLAMVAVASDRKELRMRGEFIAFLKEYGVIGLAIAVVIGGEDQRPGAGAGGCG